MKSWINSVVLSQWMLYIFIILLFFLLKHFVFNQEAADDKFLLIISLHCFFSCESYELMIEVVDDKNVIEVENWNELIY